MWGLDARSLNGMECGVPVTLAWPAASFLAGQPGWCVIVQAVPLLLQPPVWCV